MKALYLLPLSLLSFLIAGCGSDDSPGSTTQADTGAFTDGPTTGRPDDGVVDTGTATTDTGTATTDTGTATTDSSSGDTGGDAGMPTVTLTSTNQFLPNSITIKVGQTVRWVWAGGTHNVVSGTSCTPDNKFCNPNDKNCATAPTATTGTTYERKFDTAGTFPYYCAPHCGGGMTGTVVVTP